MGRVTTQEMQDIRVKDVPKTLRRRISAYQRLLSIEADRDLTIDEAAISLWEKALDHANVPSLKS